MSSVKIAFLSAMFVLLAALVACRNSDEDEKQKSKPAAATVAGQPAQQKSEEKYTDEDEEQGASTSAAVASEKPAPVQAAGQQLAYNFDNDPVGAPPAKFHSARTGQGSESKWAVMTDQGVPSKPNVVAQTSADKSDQRPSRTICGRQFQGHAGRLARTARGSDGKQIRLLLRWRQENRG